MHFISLLSCVVTAILISEHGSDTPGDFDSLTQGIDGLSPGNRLDDGHTVDPVAVQRHHRTIFTVDQGL
jgi:hypothetical protein